MNERDLEELINVYNICIGEIHHEYGEDVIFFEDKKCCIKIGNTSYKIYQSLTNNLKFFVSQSGEVFYNGNSRSVGYFFDTKSLEEVADEYTLKYSSSESDFKKFSEYIKFIKNKSQNNYLITIQNSFEILSLFSQMHNKLKIDYGNKSKCFIQ